MQQLEDIKVINVDGEEFPVAEQSAKAQGLVSLYDEWRREELGLKKDVLKLEAALRDLSREIIGVIRAEQAEAVAAEEAAVAAAEEVLADDGAEPVVAEASEPTAE